MSPRDIYRWTSLPTEDVEKYKPGGFHPVEIGDRIGPSDRYLITRKLGYGGFSTVWLAQDTLEKNFVSIKILKASCSDNHDQIGLYKDLFNNSRSAGGKEAKLANADTPEWTQYILPMLSSFTQSGPNGDHSCMIFEPMGSTAGALMRYPPTGYPGIGIGLGTYFGKIVLRQMLGAIVSLHAQGIIHGDLHIDNVLLPLQLPPKNNREGIAPFFTPQQIDNESARKVRRRDKKQLTENVPKHLMVPIPSFLHTLTVDNTFHPRVIDITGATPKGGLSSKTPIYLQSPELVLDNIATENQDIWAFGFAIYEVLTGCRPISGISVHCQHEHRIDEMMLSFNDFVGTLPLSLRAKWGRYSEYFDKNDRRNKRYPSDIHKILIEDDIEGSNVYDENGTDESETSENNEDNDDDGASERDIQDDNNEEEGDFQAFFEQDGGAENLEQCQSSNAEAEEKEPQNPRSDAAKERAKRPPPQSGLLEDLFDFARPPEMGSEETEQIKDLLRSIFQYDPQKRPRAVDLQKHPWFAESFSDDGGLSSLKLSTTKKSANGSYLLN